MDEPLPAQYPLTRAFSPPLLAILCSIILTAFRIKRLRHNVVKFLAHLTIYMTVLIQVAGSNAVGFWLTLVIPKWKLAEKKKGSDLFSLAADAIPAVMLRSHLTIKALVP